MLDLVVKNGRIIDGTGNPWFKADIGIKGGLITKIGSTNSLGVKRILDVRGFVVCPGFIDIHSHADKQRGEHGRLRAKSHLEQGITTEIVGNCGFSAAPFMGLHADNVVKRCETNLGFKVDWKTVGQFLNRIDRRGNGTNIAFLVGHGTLRECVMGLDNRPPNEEELSNMKRLLQEAMEDGAFGLSVGLMYEPGCWADSSELVELCHVVASHGGLLAADLRNWLDPVGFVDSLDEIIDIAKRANVPVEISHFKVKFPTLPLTEQTYKKMEEARERGIDITGDMLAFPQLPLSIQTYLECWIYEAARETLPRNLQAWLKSPENKEELKKKLNRLSLPWDIIRIFNVTSEKGKYLEGSTIQEIADSKGIEPIDLLLDFIVNGIVDTRLRLHARPAMEKVKLSMTFLPDTTSDDEPVARLQASHPAIMFGSDTAEATYPRFLRWHTREKGYLTLQEAIRKSTSFPAQRIGLQDRGLIKKGVWADLVVFDEETVGEQVLSPTEYRVNGIKYVLVNGEIAVEEGEYTGAIAGKGLRKHSVRARS